MKNYNYTIRKNSTGIRTFILYKSKCYLFSYIRNFPMKYVTNDTDVDFCIDDIEKFPTHDTILD